MELYNLKPHLRDGVDVYYSEESEEVVFVFLATRKRIRLKCNKALVMSLTWLTGDDTVDTLHKRFLKQFQELPSNAFIYFIQYLLDKGLILQNNWIEDIKLPVSYKNRLNKQLNFLLDLAGDSLAVERIQRKIFSSKVAICGVGAVGSWICRELVMMGFREFILIDYKTITKNSVARHACYQSQQLGIKKIDACKAMILGIDPDANIRCFSSPLTIDTEVSIFLKGANFIVNTTDEPYIGYTSIALSRYCVKNSLPLVIAGGFDAHLGCLGELIIPGITPCSDCYNVYFQKALVDWKPIEHPVKDRTRSFGGLPSLAAFSASTAAMSILRYFIDPVEASYGGRGELLFDEYIIDAFTIGKNENCITCGAKND